jgi:hypothetical protein
MMTPLRTAARAILNGNTAELPGSGPAIADRLLRYVGAVGALMLLFSFVQSAHSAEPAKPQFGAHSLKIDQTSAPRLEPLSLPQSQLEPIDWSKLDGWLTDDHAAAYATFLASCRPLLRTVAPMRSGLCTSP